MSYKMSDENLNFVLEDLEELRLEREKHLAEMMREQERRMMADEGRRSAMKTMFARRRDRDAGLLRPMFDPNAPRWCAWRATYANVADVMVRAEQRGFFKMKDRDRDLCTKIISEERISEKQRSWLGGISLKYLQDGVYEGFTWWSMSPERNLVSRWNAILEASSKPETTVEELTEITGNEFMARYQKVLAAKS